MTQAKAASLTSALFARKGAASPADLVIAELEDGSGGKVPTRKARSKERGGESAQRKKAKLPEVEQELPLLAFVDAQTSEAVSATPAEQSPAADHVLADHASSEDGHPDPAASLMAHRPLAFSGKGSPPDPDDTFTDDIAADPVSDPESPEAEGAALAAAADDEEAQEVPAGEAVIAEATVVAAQTDHDVIEAVPLAEAEASLIVGEDEVQVIAASLPVPANETVESETGTDGEGALPSAGPSAGSSPGPDSAEIVAPVDNDAPPDDGPVDETPAVEVSVETENGSTTAALNEDRASAAEPTEQKNASETTTRAAVSAVSLPAESQDRERHAAAAAPAVAQVVDTLADLQDREKSEAAANSPAASPAVLAAKRSAGLVSSPWRIAATIALGVGLGLSGYALWPKETSEPELVVVEPRPDSTESGSATAQDTAPQNTASNEIGDAVADAEVVQTAAGPASQPPAALAGAKDTLGGQSSQPEPSFDIIRIEPNGQSIIAGRADPFSEWILLNNGEPIGSVQADLNGEWVILPDASLIPGANDFSLVPKTERGKVAIPAADEPPAEAIKSDLPERGLLAPRSERSSSSLDEKLAALGQDAALPLPLLKPSDDDAKAASFGVRVSPDGGYQIQIASVRQSAAAERERARLVDVYPGLLGALDLRVQEASIDGAGVFYRLRSGPIVDLADARELCRQLELRGQSCLVVVRAEDDVVPNPFGINAVQPLAAPGLSSTQQAENPD